MSELSLQEVAKQVTEKASAYGSVYGVKPAQPELDALFRLQAPDLWRAWLAKTADDQMPLLRCWLGAVKRLRQGGKPADTDPLMLALRILAKIEELASSTASAIVALSAQTEQSRSPNIGA